MPYRNTADGTIGHNIYTVREANPRTSLPEGVSFGDFEWYEPTPPPEAVPHLQVAVEVAPQIVGGVLRQRWELQDAPPPEEVTMRQAKHVDFSTLKIAIIGDIRHSRVARSDLHALRTLGAEEIRVCAPESLLPDDETLHGCHVTRDFDEALVGADVLMMLRLQRERMDEGLVSSLEDYHRDYGLTAARLKRAAPDAVVMHPGPMNRGVEIDDAVADGPRSLILKQVANGVAVRMAVLETLLSAPE